MSSPSIYSLAFARLAAPDFEKSPCKYRSLSGVQFSTDLADGGGAHSGLARDVAITAILLRVKRYRFEYKRTLLGFRQWRGLGDLSVRYTKYLFGQLFALCVPLRLNVNSKALSSRLVAGRREADFGTPPPHLPFGDVTIPQANPPPEDFT